MTEALRWGGFAIAAAMICMVLKAAKREAGMVAALAAGVMLLSAIAERLGSMLGAISALAEQANLSGETLSLLMKTLGAAYVTEFACQVCMDAGEAGMASKVSLMGKLLMLSLAWPLLNAVCQMILSLTP